MPSYDVPQYPEGGSVMPCKKARQALHITFHNPNTPEETANYLIDFIAAELAHRVEKDGVSVLETLLDTKTK